MKFEKQEYNEFELETRIAAELGEEAMAQVIAIQPVEDSQDLSEAA